MLGVQLSPLLPSLLRLALLLVGFVLPGYGIAAWLLGPPREDDGFGLRLLLGFVVSFALFSLLTAPSLWLGHSYAAVQARVLWTWVGYAAVGLLCFVQTRRAAPASTPPSAERADDPADAATGLDSPASPFPLRLAHLAYLLLGLALIFAYGHIESARPLLFSLALLLCLLGLRLFRRSPPQHATNNPCPIAPSPTAAAPRAGSLRTSMPSPRTWQALALVAVVAQGGLMTLYDRPDWDDCFYVAAALDYPQATALNAQEPTHREGLAMPVQQRTLCWILWGAMLSQLSGVSPMGLFHSVLPLALLPLLYIAYAALLSRLLPRAWVPLGIVALSVLHCVGIGHHDDALNFALPRLGQGKAVLLHIALPLLSALLLRVAAAPGLPAPRQVLALVLTVLFAIGVSLSALFLGIVLLCTLGLSLLIAERLWRRRMALSLTLLLSALPLLAIGLWLRPATQKDALLASIPTGNIGWLDTVRGYLGTGSSVLLWLVLVPPLGALLRGRAARAYLLGFPACLALSFANPLLFHVVARSLSSYPTYARILWLFPVGVGVAVSLVLGTAALARHLRHREWGPRHVRSPLPLLGIALLCVCLLPGLFVFGPRNSFIGPLGTPHRSENVDRIPGDLLPLAAMLHRQAQGDRILCNEQIASFLAPYSTRLRFVQTRTSYTAVWLAMAGRPQEGAERALLGSLPRVGDIGGPHEPDNWLELRLNLGDATLQRTFGPAMATASHDLRSLLARYRVRYVVLGPGDRGEDRLRALGYTPAAQQGRFLLLRAPDEPAQPR